MDGTNSKVFVYSARFCSLLLFTLLYLCYSPTFLTDYLTNDEVNGIGRSFHTLEYMRVAFFRWGRGLFGLYEATVYHFVGFDPFKVQIVRFVNFVSLAAIAIILFRYTLLKSRSIAFSLIFVILFYSQPALHGLMGYSLQLISNTQPAMWLSLLSFWLHFHIFRQRRMPRLLEYGLAAC